MKETLLSILLAIQHRQLHGVWQVQRAIEDVSNAIANNQELDSAKLVEMTSQLRMDTKEMNAAVEAAKTV